MATKCTECGHEHENWLPKERYDKLLKSKKDAEAATKEAKGQVAELENQLAENGDSAATIKSLNDRIAEFEGQRATWDLEKSIMGAGVADTEGIGVIAMLYGALPEDKRPEGGVKAWLESDDAPRAAKTYLTAAESGETKTGEEKKVDEKTTEKKVGIPSGNVGAKTAGPAANSEYTAESVGGMTLAEYATHRNNLRAERGLPPIEAPKA